MADRVSSPRRSPRPGCERLREAGVDVELELERASCCERIGDYDALVVRSATKVDAELIAAAERLRVIGRAGVGRGQRRRRRPRRRRGILVCNAPQSNIALGRRARHRADARAGPPHPARRTRALVRRALGALALRGRRAGRQDARACSASAASASSWPRAPAPSACAWSRTTPSSPPSASASAAPSAPRPSTAALARPTGVVSLHLPATDRHAPRHRRPPARADAARRAPRQRGARRPRGHRGAGRGAALGARRGRGDRRLRAGAAHRVAAVRAAQRRASRRTSAPRRAEAQDRAGAIIAEQVVAGARRRAGRERRQHARTCPTRTAPRSSPSCRWPSKLGRVWPWRSPTAGVSASRSRTTGQLARARHAAADARRCWGRAARASTRASTSSTRARWPSSAASRCARAPRGRRRLHEPDPRRPRARRCAVAGTLIGRDNRPWLVRALGHEVEIELAGPMLFLLNDDRPGHDRPHRHGARRRAASTSPT